MKKIVSLLIATALSLTALASVVSAELITSTNKATLSISAVEIDESDALKGAVDFVGDAELENYAYYRVTVTAGNLPQLTKDKTKYTGEGITYVAARMNVTTEAEYEADWFMATPVGRSGITDAGSNVYIFKNDASDNALTLLVADNIPANGSITVGTFDVAISTDYDYTFTLDAASNMQACVYSNATKSSGTGKYNVIAAKNNIQVDTTPVPLSSTPSTVLATSMATFTPATLNLQVGGSTGTITAALNSEATDQTIDWSTSDPSVATVSNGVVTPVAAGTATITATAHDGSGVNATCTVTVKAANPAPILSQNFAKIDAGTALKDLKDASVDASVNYGAGRISTTVETDKYDYKVVAQDADSGETKEWDAPMAGAEISGSINFIAIVKSATHTIGSIWLQAVVK